MYLLNIAYIFFDNFNSSFYCSHLWNMFQFFTAVHKSNVLKFSSNGKETDFKP